MEMIAWEKIEQHLQRNVFPGKADDVIILGAGFTGLLETPLLIQEDLRIVAFCDNDPKKQNTEILGLPCIAPKHILDYARPFVLTASTQYCSEISKQLSELEVPFCTVAAYVIWKNSAQFRNACDLLDETSQKIYIELLLHQMSGDKSGITDFCTDSQYFALPKFRFCGKNEVFVDCGAYTGDTTESFIKNVSGYFQKIYAFEPNSKAFAAMERRLKDQHNIWLFPEERIKYEKKILGKVNGKMTPFFVNEMIIANASITSNTGNAEWVETVSLDGYFSGQNEDRITFLKADIEGSEWDMLLGGKHIIQRDKPKLAISIYHNIYDFFRIPLLLKKLVPEYCFAVRHHWSDFCETILYCWIE